MKPLILKVVLALTCGGLCWGAPNPTELLRAGVIAEESGPDTAKAQELYRQAAVAGEEQRTATATALYRLGELEWRQGRTNEAVRTWRLLVAQYQDQTNLIQLARERAPKLVVSPAGPTVPAALPEVAATTPLARAAAAVGQIEKKHPQEIARWLTLHGVATPELTDMLQRRSALRQRASELSPDYGPGHPENIKLQRMAELLDKEISREALEIISILRATAEATDEGRSNAVPAAGASGASVAPPADPDVSPEEQAELARVKRLLRDSPDLLTAPTGFGGVTPLESAAAQGYSRVVGFLLENKFAIQGTGALVAAARAGQQAVVRQLLAAGADVNERYRDMTPLTAAIWQRNQRVVETLLAAHADAELSFGYRPLTGVNGDLNRVWTSGTPLRPVHLAVGAKNLPALEALVKAGADLNSTNASGATPLHWAVVLRDEAIVRFLLSQKVDVQIATVAGMTPLALTSERLSATDPLEGPILGILNQLLEAKADPNRFQSATWSPLWFATASRNPFAVERLLRAGAVTELAAVTPESTANDPKKPRSLPGLISPMLADRSDVPQTILELACPPADTRVRGPGEFKLPEWKRRLVPLLVTAGARQPAGRKRLLTLAVESEDPDIVAFALKQGEPADLPNELVTPLFLSIRTSLRIVELLLEAGANPNRTVGDRTPYLEALSMSQNSVEPWREPSVERPYHFLPQQDRLMIRDALTRHGGRPFYSNPSLIAFGTAITNQLQALRERTAVSVEREFTLCDLLDTLLLRQLKPGEQERSLMPWYPDLKGAYLWNDRDRTHAPQKRALDLPALIETGDFGKSIPVEWGDILIIPARPSGGNEEPYVLPSERSQALERLQYRHLTVRLSGRQAGDKTEQLIFRGGMVSRDGTTWMQVDTGSRDVPRLLSYMRGLGPFHNRFRVVRRRDTGALDRIYTTDVVVGPDGRVQSYSVTGTPSIFRPGSPSGLIAPTAIAGGDGTGVAPSGESGENGNDFRFQDGDEITLYPLPKP